MNRARRLLLEFWALAPTAAVVGFLGPFGTYLRDDFPHRAWQWWLLLMGAYVLARPALLFWRWAASATGLPRRSVNIWGIVLSSFPIALIWHLAAPEGLQGLQGYVSVLPFAMLCSLLVVVVAWWAERADAHLAEFYREGEPLRRDPEARRPQGPGGTMEPAASGGDPPAASRPRLLTRLGPGFPGPIHALESEDHYVRVHGEGASELILMRLRDAISEMDGTPGEQTHRSWWVASAAVQSLTETGRSRELLLAGGLRAPIARESFDRLLRSGFIPTPSGPGGAPPTAPG